MHSFNDVFNVSDTGTLYIYKIDTSKPLKFQKNSFNFVKLKKVSETEYAKISTELVPSSIEQDSTTLLNLTHQVKINTTEQVNLPYNNFYIFFLESPQIENNQIKNGYVLNSNTVENIFNLTTGTQEVSELTITPLETLKELEGIEFFVVNEDLQDQQITLTLNAGSLLNLINFYKFNDKLQNLKYSYASQLFPYVIYANPLNLNNDTLNFFMWSFSSNHAIPLKGISSLIEVRESYKEKARPIPGVSPHIVPVEFVKFDLINYLHLREFYDLIINLIEKTRIFYKGTKQEKENLARDFDIKNIREYNDFLILEAKQKYPEFEHLLSTTLILLSEQIDSSYCWKGGLNNENAIFSPFTLYYQNNEFLIKSEFLSWNLTDGVFNLKNNTAFLNFNLYKYKGYFLNLPSLPAELSEQDFSQKPVDFNDKSFNFNYPFYLFINDRDFSNYQKTTLPLAELKDQWSARVWGVIPSDINNLTEWNKWSLLSTLSGKSYSRSQTNPIFTQRDTIYKVSDYIPGTNGPGPTTPASAIVYVQRSRFEPVPLRELKLVKSSFESKNLINEIFNTSGDTFAMRFEKEETANLHAIEIRAVYLETLKIAFSNTTTTIKIKSKDINPIHKIFIW